MTDVPWQLKRTKEARFDSQTVQSQIRKMKDRFGLDRAVLVSDRGMVTHANLAALNADNLDWITALKAPQVQKLALRALPLSLFEQQNLAQITADDYPGERLVVCRNTLVAEERRRKREELLGDLLVTNPANSIAIARKKAPTHARIVSQFKPLKPDRFLA